MSNARAALVSGGTVQSVIVVDTNGSYTPPAGHTVYVLDEGSLVGPGWTYADGTFTPPTESESAGPALPSILDVQQQLDDLTDFIVNNF